MSQDYTDDCFASAHNGQEDLANIEKNFACLKSSFSGASAPANPVEGLHWLDTTSHIIKIRNEANNAWLNFFNAATGKADDAAKCSDITITAGTGLSGGGALSASRTISHAAHTGDVTGAGALTIGAKKVLASMMNDGTNERGWVLARIAAAAVGAVGTYALCSGNNVPSTGLDPGDTISGSYLNYSDTTAGKYTTSTPSGTWMCMGRSVASYDETHYNGSPTLFLRIS